MEKALDGAMDAKNIKATDELLSPTALAGRGRIGRALDRVQEVAFECEESDYLGTVLDLYDLAEPFLPSVSSPARRSLSDASALGSKENDTGINTPTPFSTSDHSHHTFDPRAGPKPIPDDKIPCLFDDTVG
jgi:hypothetical protein